MSTIDANYTEVITVRNGKCVPTARYRNRTGVGTALLQALRTKYGDRIKARPETTDLVLLLRFCAADLADVLLPEEANLLTFCMPRSLLALKDVPVFIESVRRAEATILWSLTNYWPDIVTHIETTLRMDNAGEVQAFGLYIPHMHDGQLLENPWEVPIRDNEGLVQMRPYDIGRDHAHLFEPMLPLKPADDPAAPTKETTFTTLTIDKVEHVSLGLQEPPVSWATQRCYLLQSTSPDSTALDSCHIPTHIFGRKLLPPGTRIKLTIMPDEG